MVKKTELYNWHRDNGAKIVEFSGYLMPVSYAGVLKEHQAVRERCGLFDISHMGEIFVSGSKALDFIQGLFSNNIEKIADSFAQYTLLLNEEGFALDDLIVYRFSPEKILVCANAANVNKDYQWIKSHAPEDINIDNQSEDYGMLALQGPKSVSVLEKLNFDLKSLKRFQFVEISLAGIPLILARTGYTGEIGCEFFVKNEHLLKLWETLLQAGEEFGIEPIGLGARDTLRLEKGYVLYGHELNEQINPMEAGLSWVIDFSKSNFIGKTALEKIKREGVRKKLVGLVMEDKGVPRDEMEVLAQNHLLGKVLSGTQSPTLNKGIATVLVDIDQVPEDGRISVDIRGKMKKAMLTNFPIV